MEAFHGKQIFITGGGGYLGRALTTRFQKLGAKVTAPTSSQANLTEQHSLDPYTATYDFVFHLAAWTQAGDFCLTHMGEQWLINQQINTTVLNWWHRTNRAAKFISIGTSCSYPTDLRLTEENYLLGTPIKDLYTYAMTKRMLYIGQRSLSEQFGMKYLTVVPSTLYGPGYEPNGKQSHFIFDLINKLLAAKELGQPVTLWGDGYQKRELVFIDDFVDCLLALTEKFENTLVNIGGGEEFTIRQFAELICAEIGLDPQVIQYDTSRYVGARSKFLEVDRLRTLLPNQPRTSLKDGLAKAIAYMKERKQYLK